MASKSSVTPTTPTGSPTLVGDDRSERRRCATKDLLQRIDRALDEYESERT